MSAAISVYGSISGLVELIVVRPVYPSRCRIVFDAFLGDVHEAVPAILPLQTLGVSATIRVSFHVVGKSDGNFTTVCNCRCDYRIGIESGRLLAFIVA
jgi:hypothetical protein